MRALLLEVSGDLTIRDVPEPRPEIGELLIRVYAAGVTPTELGWYPTTHTRAGELRRNAIPGHEFSGVIVDPGASDFQTGQEVYGMNDWFQDGATAEYCTALPSQIALKPPGVTHAAGASVPIGALTAWQGLFDRAGLQAGERVLVQGGAGAVGVYAIQLASERGARVTATASAHNLEFVRKLGAEQAIDYRAQPFDHAAGPYDVVFDTVGGETLERSWGMLKPTGRMVTIAAEDDRDERAQKAFFIVEPNSGQLTEIAKQLDAGRLQTVVDMVIPFEQAPAAYSGTLAGRRGRGKVVVAVKP